MQEILINGILILCLQRGPYNNNFKAASNGYKGIDKKTSTSKYVR